MAHTGSMSSLIPRARFIRSYVPRRDPISIPISIRKLVSATRFTIPIRGISVQLSLPLFLPLSPPLLLFFFSKVHAKANANAAARGCRRRRRRRRWRGRRRGRRRGWGRRRLSSFSARLSISTRRFVLLSFLSAGWLDCRNRGLGSDVPWTNACRTASRPRFTAVRFLEVYSGGYRAPRFSVFSNRCVVESVPTRRRWRTKEEERKRLSAVDCR